MNKLKLKLSNFIHNKLGPDYGGTPSPPGSECKLEFGYVQNNKHKYIATTYNNDGFELWLGKPDKWHIHYNNKEARKLAWFILRTWWEKPSQVYFGDIEDNDSTYKATTNNGFLQLYLGRKHCVSYTKQDARKLTWFILYTWWFKSTWFGLKRKLWYMALSNIVSSYNTYEKHNEFPSTTEKNK